MNKKGFISITVIYSFFLVFLSLMLFMIVNMVNSRNLLNNVKKTIKNDISENTIIYMFETEAGSGEYVRADFDEAPIEKYMFNAEKSRCKNGSTLTWNDTTKALTLSGTKVDICYAYFDLDESSNSIADVCSKGETLSDCIISLSESSDPSLTNIYHHDGTLENGLNDGSYRYSSKNPNNYVCFGSSEATCPTDNLYRIIGVIDGKVKLIKYDYATSALLGTDGDYYGTKTPDVSYYKGSLTTINTYYWNYKATNAETNTWSTSLLNKTNLNTNFINNIGEEWANKIATTTWKVGGNTYANIYSVVPATAYQNEIVNPVTTNTTDNATQYSAKIGLMYVSDYGFAADPSAWTTTLINYDGSVNGSTIRSLNWMYMGYNEWTISRSANYSITAFGVYDDGDVRGDRSVNNSYAARPVFNLESSVTYKSGSGTSSDPIRIN